MEPEKKPAAEREELSGQPGEQREVRKPSVPVKAVFWITVVLLVALAGLTVALVICYSKSLATVFVVLIFIFAILNKACWKCPACGKHLGRFGRPKSCPHCGEALKL